MQSALLCAEWRIPFWRIEMNANFDKKAFEKVFSQALRKLAGAEKITKDVLRDMSRSVLEAHHATEDVAYINQIIPVLTPINRKVAILFFKEFSGFQWDDETKRFTKKSKKHYDAKHQLSMDFLADPHQNIWTWAERNVEVEKKPAPSLLDKVEIFIHDVLPKAEKAGITQAEIITAIFKAGVKPEAVIAAFDAMGLELAEVEPEKQNEQAPF